MRTRMELKWCARLAAVALCSLRCGDDDAPPSAPMSAADRAALADALATYGGSLDRAAAVGAALVLQAGVPATDIAASQAASRSVARELVAGGNFLVLGYHARLINFPGLPSPQEAYGVFAVSNAKQTVLTSSAAPRGDFPVATGLLKDSAMIWNA